MRTSVRSFVNNVDAASAFYGPWGGNQILLEGSSGNLIEVRAAASLNCSDHRRTEDSNCGMTSASLRQ